jgi:capsule polysaccharide export protein KpsC/LpsZ
MERKVIAVDFDGTLCENNYPDVGEIKPEHKVIHELVRKLHKNGDVIILWTCRGGKELEAAVSFCRQHNIPIDYVNENYPERVKLYGCDSRKISADLYIDDKSLGWEFIKTLLVEFDWRCFR